MSGYVKERLAELRGSDSRPASGLSAATTSRFWAKVAIQETPDVCWEWTGAVAGSGYGSFKVNREAVSAHRIAYRMANGRLPAGGLVIRHKCDNPRCVNPAHLEEGTKADNSMDMVTRGRNPARNTVGENNGAAKLTLDKVSEIRRRGELGETNVSIAASFGVTHQMVSKIRKGYFWK
jgi:hypothetical protein